MPPADDALSRFQERLERWRALHERYGPGRSYPHAWRLPDFARSLDGPARLAAWRALALDLFTLGRVREARRVMETSRTEADLADLYAACGALIGIPTQTESNLTPEQGMWIAYLADDAEQVLARSPLADPWSNLLRMWAASRLEKMIAPEEAHRTAAMLRARSPTAGARAEALLAEILFLRGPRWSVPWLDLALDVCEARGQHFLKPRLLQSKAAALSAAGALGEAQRFHCLRQELLRRLDWPDGESAPGDGGEDRHLHPIL